MTPAHLSSNIFMTSGWMGMRLSYPQLQWCFSFGVSPGSSPRGLWVSGRWALGSRGCSWPQSFQLFLLRTQNFCLGQSWCSSLVRAHRVTAVLSRDPATSTGSCLSHLRITWNQIQSPTSSFSSLAKQPEQMPLEKEDMGAPSALLHTCCSHTSLHSGSSWGIIFAFVFNSLWRIFHPCISSPFLRPVLCSHFRPCSCSSSAAQLDSASAWGAAARAVRGKWKSRNSTSTAHSEWFSLM